MCCLSASRRKTLPTLSLRMAGKSECQLQHIEPNLPSGLCQYGELKPSIHCRTPKKKKFSWTPGDGKLQQRRSTCLLSSLEVVRRQCDAGCRISYCPVFGRILLRCIKIGIAFKKKSLFWNSRDATEIEALKVCSNKYCV